MSGNIHFSNIATATISNKKLLAILVDPEKFDSTQTKSFLAKLPKNVTHFFVGGSTGAYKETQKVIASLKMNTALPVFIFPGNYTQISETADALLFLSLHSGDNPEYLIGQQRKAAAVLKETSLEIIATSYVLIDGGIESAVARVSKTNPLAQLDVEGIVHTALAGQLMGAKLVYLEAGSGAQTPVATTIISEVKKVLDIPLIVGGGIRTQKQREQAYLAGADMVVMGTVYEK